MHLKKTNILNKKMNNNQNLTNPTFRSFIMTDVDKKLLTRIYQDAKVGTLGSEEVLEKCTDEKFKALISRQMSSYDLIAKECETIAKSNKIVLPDNSFFKKIKQTVMINFSLFFDGSDRHIAEMMITGTTMGIIDAIKSLYDLDKADDEIVKIGKKLQSMQEKYVEDLKVYLQVK